MSKLEILANVVNLISVILAARNNIHTWWTGILGCVLYFVMFFQVNLYADVTLQVFFIVTCLYGWYNWKLGKNKDELPITHTGFKNISLTILSAILLTIGYGYILFKFTNAACPFVDSLILFLSIIGQIMLMNRKLESWYFWIVVDLIAVPLYFYKDLKLTSLVYFLFLLNAVYGLISWKRELKEDCRNV